MSPKGGRRGERFGRYEILAELGRGAMGIVYKARDPKINRVVAVKTFSLASQSPEEEQEYRERFFREAEAAGRLSHPGIVTIFDVGEEPGTHAPYIVMEFVSGQSLEKWLAQEEHKLSLEAALQLTHELAEALDCAHGQGVVHRDLKPSNILITEDGHAKIADFGVAKLNLGNHTLGGRTLGTPAYMSPEQLNGELVDGRSDLFALGIILYTVLTGYRPFQGNSAMTVSFKVVNREPVPATVLDTELPPGIDYIIGRAMAKDPAQRYQRGMEMALDVQDLREGRELWSKAKQPDLQVGSHTQPLREKTKSSSKGQRAATPIKSNGNSAAHNLVDKMRNPTFAAVVLAAGLLLLAVRIGHLVWPSTLHRQNLEDRRIAASVSAADHSSMMNTVPPPVPELSSRNPAASVSAAGTAQTRPAMKSGSRSGKASSTMKPVGFVRSGTSSAVDKATLEIEVEHNFAEAHLSIWVDGTLSYTHRLEGADKKHMVVFHHVEGHEFHAMQIPPGKHTLRVQVISDPGSSDHSTTIGGEFASGKEQMLQIHFDKHGEMNVTLE
ncbi:MAG: serine/threonine-protein kinase [Candidatus Sulfotelmatobacter sp.]